MGTRFETFTCPHCNTQMTPQAGPNWTPVAVGQAQAIVLSCPSCHRAFGSFLDRK